MAALRVFVSSTCVDLGAHREQIRGLLTRMGYEPVMSEFADVLYDPRKHTHTSCIREVASADMVILLIGSRFGGSAVPEALGEIDVANIAATASKAQLENEENKYSITQLEALNAINLGIPLFTFIDAKVYADHHTYIRNKDFDFIDKIEFPSIQKPNTAKYIFDFISFITHMSANNALLPYSSFADIESNLVKQWSGLFQTLLRETREKQSDRRKTDAILEQIGDLKVAVLQTIGGDAARNIARSVLKFRLLSDFLLAMKAFAPSLEIADYRGDFEDLLSEFGVVETIVEGGDRGAVPRTIMLREDGTLLQARVSSRRFEHFSMEWRQFAALERDTKIAVLDGVEDASAYGQSVVRIADRPFDGDSVSSGDLSTPNTVPLEVPPAASSSWSDERLSTLRALWAEGRNASEIAEVLGGVSRNAVIGKAHRLGLETRPSPGKAVENGNR